MHDLGGSDSDWWGLGWKPRLSEAQWAFPPTLPGLLGTTDEQQILLLWLLFIYFCLFSFLLAFKRKKKFWPIQVGFLHYNTDTKYAHAHGKHLLSSPTAQPPSYITRVQNCHVDKVVKKINIQLLNGQLSLSLQPRDSGYFTPWSFISTLNTADDSVHNCSVVPP